MRNTVIVFVVSGLWHGANWTFLTWGITHAILLLSVYFFSGKKQYSTGVVAENSIFPSLKEILLMGRTMIIWVLVTIFFRAESMTQAFGFFKGIFSKSLLSNPHLTVAEAIDKKILFVLILFCFIIEWRGRRDQHALEYFANGWPKFLSWLLYIAIIILSLMFFGQEQQFIYFQF